MNNILICPVCKRPLEKVKNAYKCSDGHSYDISAEGYTNLILANKKKAKLPAIIKK